MEAMMYIGGKRPEIFTPKVESSDADADINCKPCRAEDGSLRDLRIKVDDPARDAAHKVYAAVDQLNEALRECGEHHLSVFVQTLDEDCGSARPTREVHGEVVKTMPRP